MEREVSNSKDFKQIHSASLPDNLFLNSQTTFMQASFEIHSECHLLSVIYPRVSMLDNGLYYLCFQWSITPGHPVADVTTYTEYVIISNDSLVMYVILSCCHIIWIMTFPFLWVINNWMNYHTLLVMFFDGCNFSPTHFLWYGFLIPIIKNWVFWWWGLPSGNIHMRQDVKSSLDIM